MTDLPSSVFTAPPEWVQTDALWVGWPHLRDEWGAAFDGAREEIAAFVTAAAPFAPVIIAAGSPEAGMSAQAALRGVQRVSVRQISAGDIWLRDTGPIFGAAGGQRAALQFQFNGWGGKYVMPGDTQTAAAMAHAMRADPYPHAFILEGGAVDSDGQGRVMTTRECLLNPNRNGWATAEAQEALALALGARQVIWLDRGLVNDHTDGHIDNIARFIGPGEVVCQRPSGHDDPNASRYDEIKQQLTAQGLIVHTIASPGRIEDPMGAVQPASHMNFVRVNDAVLLPIYEKIYSAEAAAELAHLFPNCTLIPLPSRQILAGGGSFHCMTNPVPLHPFKELNR